MATDEGQIQNFPRRCAARSLASKLLRVVTPSSFYILEGFFFFFFNGAQPAIAFMASIVVRAMFC